MPETTSYLYLGLVIALSTLGIFILSLALRLRKAFRNTDPLNK